MEVRRAVKRPGPGADTSDPPRLPRRR